ncbi:hypothetical protein DFH94DRAFT_659708 [Russula ochroleuca]|jgi:hypothetical protein|uniref:Uncharacterized protein n=1 Tax=Russula ochroleuca TaxID=152965 RepID=A0A9P5TDX0_9AGAM|nr:hypothetical protein DFH94DRAFT_659708 [Russula ochroleuca]
MQQYNLRPVSELSRSPSSRSSGSPPNHHMSPPSSHLPPIQHSSNGAQAPPRRPISPSSLPHLDVSNGQAMPPRNYPPPPTGHDLMRLFPPQPPEQPLFLKQGSTSLYFRRQEHQFFAQAGKEIIRVRVESDFPPSAGGSRNVKGKEPVSAPHAWPSHAPPPPPPQAMQPPPEHAHAPPAHMHSPPHPVQPYPHHHPDMPRGAPGPIGATGSVAPPGYAPPHHPAAMVRNAPPPMSDDIREDDDQSWRRPTPHGERRRAGKHTRRVVVK